jgi:quercetin dioxygenase-like cupin family protein
MPTHKYLARTLVAAAAALAVLSYAAPRIEATPPQGVTFTVLNRATVPEFEALRKFRDESHRPGKPKKKFWKIDMEATRTIDVVTVLFTVQPGGDSGWHTHPGPAIFTVSAGALTMYDADDESCEPQFFPAGTGSIEADTAGHSHLLRNETDSVAQTMVTFLLPVGAPLRTDLPDPGNCTFPATQVSRL